MQLVAQNISKSFGPTQALRNVSVTLEAGQVHALVGENGAGKSTLFKICAGAIPSDAGHMTLDGKPYAPRHMHDAHAAGVALVFQEVSINPSLDIAENIYIDRLRDFVGPFGVTKWKALRRSAQEILDAIGANISVSQDLHQLDLGQWKIVEIARALSYKPQVLLLDESTAFLNSQEIDDLFKVIENLRKQGIAIGYVSHHLDEIDKIADTITILKDGAWVGNYAAGQLTSDEIEALMVGRKIGEDIYPPARIFQSGDVILSLNNVTASGQLNEVSLDLNRGEILGIGGLKGSGGEAIMGVITGDISLQQGEMIFEGQRFLPRKPSDAWGQGIAYLPGDRTGEGLLINFTVQYNITMAAVPRRGVFLDKPAAAQLARKYISKLNIKTEGPEVACSSLSGGNLQKVVLGKCMAPDPKVLLLNNPTRGVDVGARMGIYHIIRELAEQGVSVLLLSEDLMELIGMSDRILITRQGKISKVFSHAELPSEEEIIRYMI